jgi:Holliday junction DNA helicase RuvA
MIATLRGTLTVKSPTEIVVDVAGVGYALSIPLSTYETLGAVDSQVHLYTHLHVREDMLHLFGFATGEERAVFRLLIAVNGIGPKMAQGILSGIPVPDLKRHLATGNTGALKAIPGVGRKLAERLVLELREKIGKTGPTEGTSVLPSDPQGRVRAEALLALTSLGYNRTIAEKAVRAAQDEFRDQLPPLETLLKAALRHVGS